MKHYAGLDVSMKETFVCVVDHEGRRVFEKSLKTAPEVIFEFLHSLQLDLALVGLESGSLSHWLTTELSCLGLPVKCIDARHIAAVLSVKVNKTDRNDARGIADAMRCGLYKEVQPKKRDDIALCTVLNCRKQLVNQRVQLFGCVRGLLKPFGIRLGAIGNSLKSLDIIRTKLTEIPQVAAKAIDDMLNVLAATLESIRALDKQVKAQVVVNEKAKLLMTVPGVGPVTALRFLAEIGDPKRFSKSKSVGAYVGMTPRQYSSGETHKQGRISKCGPKELRGLLMEAGVVILMRTNSWSKLKAWGLKIQRKHGLKKAATAVGRKLGTIMHRMLITGEPFKFTDQEEYKKAA